MVLTTLLLIPSLASRCSCFVSSRKRLPLTSPQPRHLCPYGGYDTLPARIPCTIHTSCTHLNHPLVHPLLSHLSYAFTQTALSSLLPNTHSCCSVPFWRACQAVTLWRELPMRRQHAGPPNAGLRHGIRASLQAQWRDHAQTATAQCANQDAGCPQRNPARYMYSCKYSSHSFRIGAASAAAAAGIPDWQIQALGRWSSDCYRGYIRLPDSNTSNIAATFARSYL